MEDSCRVILELVSLDSRLLWLDNRVLRFYSGLLKLKCRVLSLDHSGV